MKKLKVLLIASVISISSIFACMAEADCGASCSGEGTCVAFQSIVYCDGTWIPCVNI